MNIRTLYSVSFKAGGKGWEVTGEYERQLGPSDPASGFLIEEVLSEDGESLSWTDFNKTYSLSDGDRRKIYKDLEFQRHRTEED